MCGCDVTCRINELKTEPSCHLSEDDDDNDDGDNSEDGWGK